VSGRCPRRPESVLKVVAEKLATSDSSLTEMVSQELPFAIMMIMMMIIISNSLMRVIMVHDDRVEIVLLLVTEVAVERDETKRGRKIEKDVR
jgi:hypothetical protein